MTNSPEQPALATLASSASASKQAAGPERSGQILVAARRLWGRHGYHRVSLRQIADESGGALGLIHHYFGAKHTLFAASVNLLAIACENTRRQLPTEHTTPYVHRHACAAKALFDPLWALSQSGAGMDALRLWLLHRHDPLPELRLPMDQAALPLKSAVADMLHARQPALPLPAVMCSISLVFGLGVELLAGDTLHTVASSEPFPDTPGLPPARFTANLNFLIATLRASLGRDLDMAG